MFVRQEQLAKEIGGKRKYFVALASGWKNATRCYA